MDSQYFQRGINIYRGGSPQLMDEESLEESPNMAGFPDGVTIRSGMQFDLGVNELGGPYWRSDDIEMSFTNIIMPLNLSHEFDQLPFLPQEFGMPPSHPATDTETVSMTSSLRIGRYRDMLMGTLPYQEHSLTGPVFDGGDVGGVYPFPGPRLGASPTPGYDEICSVAIDGRYSSSDPHALQSGTQLAGGINSAGVLHRYVLA